jgi:hypothetical protein
MGSTIAYTCYHAILLVHILSGGSRKGFLGGAGRAAKHTEANAGQQRTVMKMHLPSIATKQKRVMRKRDPIGCQTGFVWTSNIA